MKEWICRELSTSTGNSENGVLMRETELIRCKDCKWYYGDYCGGFGDGSFTPEDGFCHNAEGKEECGHQ